MVFIQNRCPINILADIYFIVNIYLRNKNKLIIFSGKAGKLRKGRKTVKLFLIIVMWVKNCAEFCPNYEYGNIFAK